MIFRGVSEGEKKGMRKGMPLVLSQVAFEGLLRGETLYWRTFNIDFTNCSDMRSYIFMLKWPCCGLSLG